MWRRKFKKYQRGVGKWMSQLPIDNLDRLMWLIKHPDRITRFGIYLSFFGFLLLIGVIVTFYRHNNRVSAAWWNDAWQYRKQITVTVAANASDVTDVETLLTIDTTGITDKMQTNCEDIRFTNRSGEKLAYYIDSCDDNSADNKVWVMADKITANTTKYTLYMYYGNDAAASESNSELFWQLIDLVGYWPTNESSWNGTSGEIKDYSINANNGTSAYDSAITSSGKYGNAGTFDGTTDYASIPSNAALNLTQFTVSLWAKADSFTGRTTPQGFIISKGTYPGYNYRILTDSTSGNRFETAAQLNGAFTSLTTTTNTYSTGTWYHVVSTYDGSTLTIYVDGEYENSTDVSGAAATNSSAIYLGNYISTGAGYEYDGAVDDIRIYNRALTADEVSALNADPGNIATGVYANSNPSLSFSSEEKAPSPLAYWTFDEGQGQTAHDSSPQSNDAQLGSTSGSESSDPTWRSADMCVLGSCLEFDGSDDYVDTGHDYSWSNSDSFTMSTWVKSQTSSTNATILGKGYTGDWEYRLGIENTTPTFNYWNTSGAAILGLTSSQNLTVNRWHHLLVTYDGSTGYMYLDGVEVDSDSDVVGTFQDRSVNTTIGQGYYNSGVGGRTDGFIDEVKFYNYYSTPDQVKADYNNGAAAAFAKEDLSYLSNGLVGYWKMDESSWNGTANEVVDSSGNGYHGVRNGNATTAAGKFGNGGTFDGTDDRIYMSTYEVPTTAHTYSFWFKPTNDLDAADPRMDFVYHNSTARPHISFNNGTSGKISMHVTIDGIGYNDITTTTDTWSSSTWHHVVFAWDGTDFNVYVDGELENTVTHAGTAAAATGLYMGSSSGYYNDYNGLIDEARIYNRALSPQEVSALYYWAPGPIANWNFNENTGSTANDSSGNGFTGTITGAEWAPGKYGSALKFNGTDYVSISSPSFPAMSRATTISFWQYGDPDIQPQADYIFEGEDTNSYRVINAHLPWSDGTVYWDAGNSGTSSYDRISQSASAAEYEGQWNYWSFTKDASSGLMEIYLNGALWHSGTGNTSTMSDITTFNIGSRAEGDSNYDGLIDEFKIYNYVRTPKQIIADMNASSLNSSSAIGSPLSYWTFDEGSGSSTYDQTLQGNDGTITGAVWTNDGISGKALEYNGSSDYVDVGSDINIANSSFSFSAWVKRSSTGTDDFLFSQGTSGTNTALHIAFRPSNLFTCAFYSNDLDTSSAYTSTDWHHWICTYDAETRQRKIYRDGVLIDQDVASANFQGTGTARIGTRWDANASSSFNGIVDEARLYTHALTEDEVRADYTRIESALLGSDSTESDGSTPSWGASREYCIPGDTSTCNPPVAEWLMEDHVKGDSQTIADTSGNGNDGTTVDGANNTGMNCSAPGKVGAACEFDDSDDYISVTNDSSLDPSDGVITVCTWINPDTLASGAGNDDVIVSKWSPGGYVLYFDGPDQKLYFSVFDGTATRKDVSVAFSSTNTWSHVCGVNDGSNIKIYLNGMETNGDSISGHTTNSENLYIGAYDGSSQYFDGRIDQVRIYDYARTPAQIAWEYNQGAPVGYWQFDECEGNTAYDASGNDNHATLHIESSGSNTSPGTCSSGTASEAWNNGTTGKYNASLDFDGTDDYVEIADDPALDISDKISISAWIYPYDLDGGTARYFTVVAKRDGELNDVNYEIRVGNTYDGNRTDVLHFAYRVGSTWHIWDTYNNATGLVENKWQHIVLTFDYGTGSSLKFYLDGVDKSSLGSWKLGNGNTEPNNDSHTVRIGDNNSGTGAARGQFDGLIDDVKIYNYELTPEQVKLNYSQGAAVRFD